MKTAERSGSTPVLDSLLLGGVAAVCASFGWVAAQLGPRGLLAGLVAVFFGTAFVLVRHKVLLTQVAMVMSLALLLHKSFGAITTTISSGAPSIYISSFDLVLIVLYVMWLLEGTLWEDLKGALARPIFWLPPIVAFLSAVSMIVAENLRLSISEIVRWGWMYLLFLYLGARLRTRREVGVILAALAGLAVVELVVVLLQWRTGGVLGLDFLGVPTELGERTLDVGQLGRPFGTVIHPVFMGALLGSLALIFFSLALFLESRRWRLLSAALVGVCLLPLVISHTRAAAIAVLIGALIPAVVAIRQRRVSSKVLRRLAITGVLGLVVAWPVVAQQFTDNFGTDHFRLEVESRTELNEVAIEMFYDSPLLGVGLNNFEEVMGPYGRYGLIFGDNPVHNLFLLQLAETGLIGLLALLALGWGLFVMSMRLARSRHHLDRALGYGMVSVLVFYFFEEQLGFSLRQDVPLAVFWILAGLCAASVRLAAADQIRLLSAPPDDEGGRSNNGRHRRRAAASVYKRRRKRNLVSRLLTTPGSHRPRPRQGPRHVDRVSAVTLRPWRWLSALHRLISE